MELEYCDKVYPILYGHPPPLSTECLQQQQQQFVSNKKIILGITLDHKIKAFRQNFLQIESTILLKMRSGGSCRCKAQVEGI